MTIGDQIRDVKLQSDINREAAKISALSSDKIDKKLDFSHFIYYLKSSNIALKTFIGFKSPMHICN